MLEMDSQSFVNLGGLGVIGALVGIIYKGLSEKIKDMSKTVVYKDTCEVVQGRFCDEIKDLKQDIKDMRQEVSDGIKDLKRELKNGR